MTLTGNSARALILEIEIYSLKLYVPCIILQSVDEQRDAQFL